MGSLHLFVGAGGALLFMCAVGLLWERIATLPGHWMFGCLVAASLMAVGGYKVEQMVNHAAWHSEKSRGILIVGECGLLVILACLVNTIVLRSWGRESQLFMGLDSLGKSRFGLIASSSSKSLGRVDS